MTHQPPATDAALPDVLRDLAHRVRKIGLNGRFDPERAFVERDDIARTLARLAAEHERSPIPRSR